MIWLAWYPPAALLALAVLWALFVVVMWFSEKRDAGTLTQFDRVLGYVALLIGYPWDILCNVFVLPVLFLELPHELMVTTRLQRHVNGRDCWRRRLSLWFAVLLINPFSGSKPHIKIPPAPSGVFLRPKEMHDT